MTRVASVDIGTNSVLLLIAEREGDKLVALEERATITRLGEGVDKTRRLSPGACQRTLDCLSDYASLIHAHTVDQVVAVGTSAMRDAAGGEDFRSLAGAVLGATPTVLNGLEEAELTFRGALSGLDVEGPLVVFDVGGGSTEIVVGRNVKACRELHDKHSLDIGSVRLFERLLHSDPPAASELQALESLVRNELAKLPQTISDKLLIGVAGTVTTLAAIALKLPDYEPETVHGYRLTWRQVAVLSQDLSRMTTAERRALRGLSPQRADVIVAGAVIVRELMAWAKAEELIVSDRGVRWGLAERALADHQS